MSRGQRLLAGGALAVALIFGSIAWYGHSHQIAVLSPAGPIAKQEKQLIVAAVLLSLIIVVPVFGLLFGIAWKYREGNTKAKYSPEIEGSRIAETVWWTIPSLLILVIASWTWTTSHTLDPFRPLVSSTKPLKVQVIALDWKWLFIYPKQHIATVNQLEFPINTPIDFQITADAPMNSFWIPRLGGQIYAMPGMSSELHLSADNPGTYRGSTANISGQGFADMKFTATSVSELDFERWVNKVKQSPHRLNDTAYAKLAKPTTHNAVRYFSNSEPGLYEATVLKFMTPAPDHQLGVAQ